MDIKKVSVARQNLHDLPHWTKTIRRIYSGAVTLSAYQEVWKGMTALAKSGGPAFEPSYLFEYLSATYSTTQSVGIRRLLTDNTAWSLSKLIRSIKTNPTGLNLELLALKSKIDGEPIFTGPTKYFDKKKTLRTSQLDIDQKAIESDPSVARVIRYVDKNLAHDAVDLQPEDIPTFKDVDVALSLLQRLTSAYYLLIVGDSVEVVPIMPNWEGPLTHSWYEE